MTSYKIIINFEYFRSMYTWRSKTFASRKKVLSALEEIKADLERGGSPAYATWRYCPSKEPKECDVYRRIPDKVKILNIGAFYRRDGEWIPLNPARYCKRCGRLLEDAESIERGYGPDCWEIIQGIEATLHEEDNVITLVQWTGAIRRNEKKRRELKWQEPDR